MATKKVMPPKMDSYIGLTGITERAQSERLLTVFDDWYREYPDTPARRLMLGVLASRRTLEGKPSSRPGRTPPIEGIRDLFVPHPRALNLIHYSTETGQSVEEQLRKLVLEGGPALQGLQLNMCWPQPYQLAMLIEDAFEPYTIVIQFGEQALKRVENDPNMLANRLYPYVHGSLETTHLLIDPSGGEGKPFKTDEMTAYLSVLHAQNYDVRLSVAGGFTPKTVYERFRRLLGIDSDLSIDIEAGVRDDVTGADTLSLEKSERYLREALRAVRDHAQAEKVTS